jgi:hypothetical protein
MTLLLATFIDDGFILAADSRTTYLDSVTLEVVGHGADQKLFISDNVAIATFGTGAKEKVPPIINEHVAGTVSFDESVAFILQRFRGDAGVRAFVAGITASGARINRIWPAGGTVQECEAYLDFGMPPTIWSAGATEQEFTATDTDSQSISRQMLELFRRYQSEPTNGVGPPFKLAEFHQDRGRNCVLSFPD